MVHMVLDEPKDNAAAGFVPVLKWKLGENLFDVTCSKRDPPPLKHRTLHI